MAKLTGQELVRLEAKTTTNRTHDFLSFRDNGKVLTKTNFLNADGKKAFRTGWKLSYRTVGWKKMSGQERDNAVSTFILRKNEFGYRMIPGTRRSVVAHQTRPGDDGRDGGL